MTLRTTLRQGLLAMLVGLCAFPASAGKDCDVPLSRWQSRDAVLQMAVAQGWQVQRLKIDDGCYEVRGTDAQGRRFKARIDPETLKVLKLKRDDQTHAPEQERERARDGTGTPRRDRAEQPEDTTGPSSSLTPGDASRGQTD